MDSFMCSKAASIYIQPRGMHSLIFNIPSSLVSQDMRTLDRTGAAAILIIVMKVTFKSFELQLSDIFLSQRDGASTFDDVSLRDIGLANDTNTRTAPAHQK